MKICIIFFVGWRSNKDLGYSHWNHDLGGGGTHNGLDISKNIRGTIFEEAWSWVQENRLNDHILIRCYANAHTYGLN